MLYSVISAMQEKLNLSETFLERVTAQDSQNVVAWTLYSILYEQKGQELNAEITLKKVLKMNQSQFIEKQAVLNSQLNHANPPLAPSDSNVEETGETPAKKDDGLFRAFN